MAEFEPVSTKADLGTLDADDVLAGYRAGLAGAGEPGSDKSRGYWHGWRNAMVDRGVVRIDRAQELLAREIVAAARASRAH